MDELERRVRAATAPVLKVDEGAIKDADRFADELGASSIQSIELVARFEEEFDIEMADDDALAVKTVGDAAKFIRSIVETDGS